MVRITTALATALLAFNHGVQAAPSPKSGRTGFDASLKRPKGPNDIIPEFRVLEPANSFDGAPRNLNDSVPFAPAGAANQLNERAIIGTDDRVYNPNHNYPFGSIGRIGWSTGVVCSAALVGPRHVLTARHCLPNDPNVWGNFAPGFDNGLTFPESAIVLAVHEADPQGPCGIKSDWAVLILNDRLGEQRGWFGVTLPDRNRFEQPILNHQGYPGDRSGTAQPYLHANTKARSENSLDCDETGPVYTNTDTAGGQSGGPLWENRNDGPYIWGDLFGSISWGVNEGFAAFASGSGLLGAVIDLLNEFP